MIIQKSKANEPFNYPPHTAELFKAMAEGKTIKSVTCMGGSKHKYTQDYDFTLRDFVATDYFVAVSKKDNECFDLVQVNPIQDRHAGFYMDWVRSFEL